MKIIPIRLKKLIKKAINKPSISKNTYKCEVCGNGVPHFNRIDDGYLKELDKNSFVHSIFQLETLNVLKYTCPICNSTDRDRLYVLYLKKRFEMFSSEMTYQMLDIAPSQCLESFFKSYQNLNYRSMDLYMEGVDDKVDITNMEIYSDNRFDFIMCSHVLEHIANDIKAMSEIYRILKPKGFAIVMVPVNLGLEKDLENSEWTSSEDRWRYYGQYDHVRMYSKSGFINKLNEVGFKVQQFGVDYFGSDVFSKNGIHNRSVLYVVEK